jgi:nucleoside-diphosphate-sugar epimerase
MLTGATGFIGSHIAEHLVQKKIDTHLFIRRRNSIIDSLEKRGAKIHVAQYDNMSVLKASLKAAEVVIHCAGATRALKEKDYIKTNVDFTANILNVINKQQRFILISSQAAAGPSNASVPVDEETEPVPLTYYGKSKLLAERQAIKWGAENNNSFVILRPSVVYGPREKDMYNYFRLIKKGIFLLLGNGKKRFSILHVNDLVLAVMMCAEHPSCGETYFVCNDEAPSWLEIGACIKKALNKNRTLTVKIPEHVADIAAHIVDAVGLVTRKASLLNRQKIIEAKQAAWLCSNTKIKKRLHWRPEISLENGIKQTAEWYIMENWI